MPAAGYSGTPLFKKLGVKPGHRVLARRSPVPWDELAPGLPADVKLSVRKGKGPYDLVHLFTKKRAELEAELPELMARIERDGMIWVSWPKKASGVATDVTEDTVRAVALPLGLVDVKVCAVDETWSGLKLVIRKELR